MSHVHTLNVSSMASPEGKVLKAAKPRYEHFDPWNSLSTGHQRAENKLAGSVSWRTSRSMKLRRQYGRGETGGIWINDQVGAGSLDFDEKAKTVAPKHVRKRGQLSIADMLGSKKHGADNSRVRLCMTDNISAASKGNNPTGAECSKKRGLFTGLVFFVGTSASSPLVSDHKLKRLLSDNGGKICIHLARKEVTHVILGQTSIGGRPEAEGSLAASKVQKEIERISGSRIKYIGAQWVLDSLSAGKRLPETQFGLKKFAHKDNAHIRFVYKLAMAFPLSTKSSEALNVSTSPTHLLQKAHGGFSPDNNKFIDVDDDVPSSPFVANVVDSDNSENISTVNHQQPAPPGSRGTSPLKLLKSTERLQSSNNQKPFNRSPRKLSSPEKRFPVKVSTSLEKQQRTNERESKTVNLTDEKQSVKICEEIQTSLSHHEDSCGGHMISAHEWEGDLVDDLDDGFADETAFSTFSAIPDMTMFANIGENDTKSSLMQATPKVFGISARTNMSTNKTSKSPSPTHRRHPQQPEITTDLIIDFTEQFSGINRCLDGSPSKRYISPSKSQTVPNLFAHMQQIRTPSPTKMTQMHPLTSTKLSSLIDFDIPPAPTPRSMPSITPRELESLKSAFLSEISSLKASLSGKEAEVLSLKVAVGDAEKRVGECMEKFLEEQNLKEQFAVQKQEWERRSREMEQILRGVKEELVRGERDREDLEGRLEESEKRREAAEIMAQEAESKMAGIRASSTSLNDKPSDEKKSQPGSAGKSVEIAVEKVAKELHTLYKSKHEAKVAALKKSYEAKWEKRVKELEAKLGSLTRDNEELKLGRDATLSGVVPKFPSHDNTDELKMHSALDTQRAKELEARVIGLSEEVKSIKKDNSDLRSQLERERVEKGELVAACDELLTLQDLVSQGHPAVSFGVENLRGSVSRASGLRAPNFSSGSSNTIPTPEIRASKNERARSSSTKAHRLGSGMGSRSGIMNSIEKMGNSKG